MAITKERLDERIQSQKEAILLFSTWACLLLIAGVVTILVIHVYPPAASAGDTTKTLVTIGGGLISSVSSFPVIHIISRREKINIFKMFRDKLDEMSDDERARMEDLLWKSYIS